MSDGTKIILMDDYNSDTDVKISSLDAIASNSNYDIDTQRLVFTSFAYKFDQVFDNLIDHAEDLNEHAVSLAQDL